MGRKRNPIEGGKKASLSLTSSLRSERHSHYQTLGIAVSQLKENTKKSYSDASVREARKVFGFFSHNCVVPYLASVSHGGEQ